MTTSELYQSVILDHNRSPHNFGELEGANHQAEGHNPLCGDAVTVFLKLRDGAIQEVSFKASGCAISIASASLMTDALRGKSVEEARALFEEFREVLTGRREPPGTLSPADVLAGVREFPMRVKCATLPWHAMISALDGEESVSTE